MIRKLNVPAAILLIACLTLAPSALAADQTPHGWFNDLMATVKVWLMGDVGTRRAPEVDRQTPSDEPTPSLKCGGEHGPNIEPNGPGCGG